MVSASYSQHGTVAGAIPLTNGHTFAALSPLVVGRMSFFSKSSIRPGNRSGVKYYNHHLHALARQMHGGTSSFSAGDSVAYYTD